MSKMDSFLRRQQIGDHPRHDIGMGDQRLHRVVRQRQDRAVILSKFDALQALSVVEASAWGAMTGDLTVAAYPPGFVAVPRISATMKVCRSKDGTEVRLMLLEPTSSR